MSTIANTILEQMGGAGRLKAMIGARNFVGGPNDVSFVWPARAKNRANTVQITLLPSDTYKITFLLVAKARGLPGFQRRTIAEFNDIYCDQLIELFERETGLYLKL